MVNRRKEEKECMKRETGNNAKDEERLNCADGARIRCDSLEYSKDLEFPPNEKAAFISDLLVDGPPQGQNAFDDGSDPQNEGNTQANHVTHPQDDSTLHMGVAPLSPTSSESYSCRSGGTVTSGRSEVPETLGVRKYFTNPREVLRKTENIATAANGVHRKPLLLNACADTTDNGTSAFRFIDDPLSDESNLSVDHF
ncbi:uncharacterized protein [Palaemon carinicauda]|uniref:uncharacterized protein n=1 Tax=Palaemon carinicauda TaxID=392227 RepID=UPI0035B6490D